MTRPSPSVASPLSVLDRRHVHFLKSRKKQSALKELLSAMAKADRLSAVTTAEVFEALVEREKEDPSGLGRGAALPHHRSDRTRGLRLMVGISRQGIDWGAADGIPVRVVFLVLAGKGCDEEYLRLVADIAHAVKQSNLAVHGTDLVKDAETFLEHLRSLSVDEALPPSSPLARALRYEHLWNRIAAVTDEGIRLKSGKEGMVERLRSELERTAAGMDRTVVERLERLARRYDGSMSARLYNGACSHCFSHPSALDLHSIRRGELVHCASCGKLLYLKDS